MVSTTDHGERHGSLASWWRSRYGLRLLLEAGLVVGLLLTYIRVRQFTRGDLRAAFKNAREVMQFERWIGLPFEDNLQRALLQHPDLVRFLNHYYLWFHFPVAIGLLIWLYWRHNDHYFYIRRLMAVVTFVALVIHVAFPLAPPRMMPGFVDTMFRYGPIDLHPQHARRGGQPDRGDAVAALRVGGHRRDGGGPCESYRAGATSRWPIRS